MFLLSALNNLYLLNVTQILGSHSKLRHVFSLGGKNYPYFGILHQIWDAWQRKIAIILPVVVLLNLFIKITVWSEERMHIFQSIFKLSRLITKLMFCNSFYNVGFFFLSVYLSKNHWELGNTELEVVRNIPQSRVCGETFIEKRLCKKVFDWL